MKNNNWKTTAAGVLGIVVAWSNMALGILNGTEVDYNIVVATTVACMGLILAKDGDSNG